VDVEENLDKLMKQIYTYLNVINDEKQDNIDDIKKSITQILEINKKTNDTIAKNKTEFKEEMKKVEHNPTNWFKTMTNINEQLKQLKDEHHKDIDWIQQLVVNIEKEIKTINDGNNQNIDWIQQLIVNIEKEMETIKSDHHKNSKNVNNLFDENNKFHKNLNKNLQHLSKKFENSDKEVEDEFARIRTLLTDTNSRIIPPPQLIVKSPSTPSSASSFDSDNSSRGTRSKKYTATRNLKKNK
jgi:predicted  nucleic acid-binding Zn-ribbon protein